VVDDDTDLTTVVRVILLDTGRYEVRVVNRPEVALPAVQQFRPHLVLLDVMMPGLDGGQVAAAIRADSAVRTTPIVFLTAAVTGEEAGRGPIGGELYLEKPVSRDRLLDCVARCVAD
jgi:CheY-like chemotaxis protein